MIRVELFGTRNWLRRFGAEPQSGPHVAPVTATGLPRILAQDTYAE